MPQPEAEQSHSLTIRRLISATREEVFDAWLDADGMRTWMCPGDCRWAEAEIDARVGGKFRILMKGKVKDYDHTGEYKIIDRPSELAFTWISARTDQKPTLVTVELIDRGKQCELVLTHERFPRIDNVESHRGGWTKIAELLAKHVEERGR